MGNFSRETETTRKKKKSSRNVRKKISKMKKSINKTIIKLGIAVERITELESLNLRYVNRNYPN